MNKIKSKENLNPNAFVGNKKQPNQGVKTRNQVRSVFQENPINPEKKPQKKPVQKQQKHHQQQKIKKIKQNIPAELYYEDEIISHVIKTSKDTFKQFKKTQQNREYRSFRLSLLESIYKECRHFQLKPKTFFLYVHYIDSFMKTQQAKNMDLEDSLTASYACFLMAQKYEQIYPPSIHEWLPTYLHEKVYKWEGKIVFALNFKFIHESILHFFQYWSSKYEMSEHQIQNCNVVLDSIAFNYELLYKYEPQKITKALTLMEIGERKKKFQNTSILDPFQTSLERSKAAQDLRKHIIHSRDKITWIKSLN